MHMTESINHEEIADKAQNVLDQFGITEPVVDAVKIANGFEIQVKEISMPPKYATDVAGFYNEKDKTIYVQTTDKPWRKMFTVAHELGHVVLGHKSYEVLFRVQKKDGAYRQTESEANSFAASLLMPKFMLQKYLDKYNLTINDFLEMAKIFGVSGTAMKSHLFSII